MTAEGARGMARALDLPGTDGNTVVADSCVGVWRGARTEQTVVLGEGKGRQLMVAG